jgi:hypothetical protein
VDKDEGEVMRIPAGPTELAIGWRRDMVTIGGHQYELGLGDAALMEIAVDAAVGLARAWKAANDA